MIAFQCRAPKAFFPKQKGAATDIPDPNPNLSSL